MSRTARIPRIIAMANMKGGVGKTTSTICTALALSRLGRKVEVRDIDPQGSATLWASKAIDRPSSVLLTQVRANTVALRRAERYLAERGLARFDAMIPFRESIRRSSESGRLPNASGYGLVAHELIEAFAGLEQGRM